MAMYRDSVLGLCIDLTGPDGNVFELLGAGRNLARQLGKEDDWQEAVSAAVIMEAGYMTMVYLFRDFFPIVTLLGLEEIENVHRRVEED